MRIHNMYLYACDLYACFICLLRFTTPSQLANVLVASIRVACGLDGLLLNPVSLPQLGTRPTTMYYFANSTFYFA